MISNPMAVSDAYYWKKTAEELQDRIEKVAKGLQNILESKNFSLALASARETREYIKGKYVPEVEQTPEMKIEARLDIIDAWITRHMCKNIKEKDKRTVEEEL